MKTRKRKKMEAAPRGMKPAQHKRLEQHQLLLENCDVVSRAYADALAVQHALTGWLDDVKRKAARALAAVHNARDALNAHREKMIAAAGNDFPTAELTRMVGASERLGLYDDELKCIPKRVKKKLIEDLMRTSARASTAVDSALEDMAASNARINEMERKHRRGKE